MKAVHTWKRGVTLVELTIAVGIGSLLLLGIFGFARNVVLYQDEFKGRLVLLDDVREILTSMAAEIRQTQDSSHGAYALEIVDENELAFYSDITSDGYRERVRYFIEDNQLKKGVIAPSGSPIAYNDSEDVEVLMRNVESVVFAYYDESYSGEEGSYPLVAPFPPLDVRMISVSITIDDDPNREPNPLGTVEVFAQLRNLKDNF